MEDFLATENGVILRLEADGVTVDGWFLSLALAYG